ncbi:heptaprenyl diphosphate synthase [Bacillus sp. MUM 116]|nr:heptaprenyl diphosphate synthase [Bacillus sp. MUM 116]
MSDIRQKFTDILGQVEQRVLDPYLLKYIDTPIIDEDKLLILISILDGLELSYGEVKNYCLSTMLIQIALDTHEQNSISSDNEKSRQLTVLAGDYFSGLYYKLLAESEDILVIKALSEGIKEINENKISVYHKEVDTIDKLMMSIKRIECSLLIKLTEYFQGGAWNEFFENLFFIKRLLKEKDQYLQYGRSILFDGLIQIIFPYHEHPSSNLPSDQEQDLLMVCDRYIEKAKQWIEKGKNQFPKLNEMLEHRISNILAQAQPIAKTFVEEG